MTSEVQEWRLSTLLLKETDSLFTINKPSGIHSISHGLSTQSIAAMLLRHDPYQAEAGANNEEAGLVNRLDFETTGLLVAARTRIVWNRIHEAFVSSAIEKEYLIAVEGVFPSSVTLSGTISSRYRRSKKVIFTPLELLKKDEEGEERRTQPCRAHFKRMLYNSHLDLSVARVTTSTGRRHQVRVMASSIGFPLLGDTLYGSKRSPEKFVQFLAARGVHMTSQGSFFLHAERIIFPSTLHDLATILTAPLCQPIAALIASE